MAYNEALRRGWTGVAIHRELALCYFIQGEFEQARHHIDAAQSIEPDNRYVVDLQVQFATQQRDETGARTALNSLEATDRPPFYHHRVSTVEAAFGHGASAYDASRLAWRAQSPDCRHAAPLAEARLEIRSIVGSKDCISQVERACRIWHGVYSGSDAGRSGRAQRAPQGLGWPETRNCASSLEGAVGLAPLGGPHLAAQTATQGGGYTVPGFPKSAGPPSHQIRAMCGQREIDRGALSVLSEAITQM